MRPDKVEEIRGPVFIVHPSDPVPVCVAFDATRGKAVLAPLDKDKDKMINFEDVEDRDG